MLRFQLKLISSIGIREHLFVNACGAAELLVLSFDKCPQRYHRCRQQCCHCCWFNHGLSMCPHCWKLCVPCWSLSVTDCLHKRKATLDQYVNNDDRLVPEKRPQRLVIHYTFMHVRNSPLQICLPLCMCVCVCLFLHHMQGRGQTVGAGLPWHIVGPLPETEGAR